MPPKARPSGSTSNSSSSSSNTSTSTSSSSSSGSDSSSDTESSQASKKSTRSRSQSSAAESDREKKTKKKSSKKSTKDTQRTSASENDHVSDEDFSLAKKKGSKSKNAQKTPKVGPKKSATAKPIAKPIPKSKKVVDTESESDFDDSMSYSMTKLAAKANEGNKKDSTKKSAEKKKKVEDNKKQPKQKTDEKKSTAKTPPAPKSTSTPKGGSSAKSTKKSAASAASKDSKSIFTLSESDHDVSMQSDDTDTSLIRDLPRKLKSPSPPTLTPQKSKQKSKPKSGPHTKSNIKGSASAAATVAKVSATKKLVKGEKRRTRNSSASSDGGSSVKSGVSFSSSTADSDGSLMFETKKKGQGLKKGSAATTPKPKLNAKVERPTTRKQTRGTAIKRSVHITGRRDSSESESEAEDGNGSPSKKGGRGIQATKPKPQYPPLEKRSCPVPGCDSLGHLSGKLDRHFTHDACPLFHNTSDELCKAALKEHQKKDAARRKALGFLAAKSPQSTPSAEQKKYIEKVKEERILKEEPQSQDDDDDTPVTERERKLNGLASNYDLALFMEAQAGASQVIEEQLKGLPDVKGTKYIEMGRYQMEVWYQSPYPEDYTVLPKLYICEFCLKYMKASSVMKRHAAKCVWKHPPGDEIYRKDKLSVFEVCGKKYKQYCQNLCLIAKSFLDHKTLYYDVEPFLFYVMTMGDSEGCHIVGYFSKEKNSFLNYNVSCILTLPPYQRQGYGRLLIDFSYLLSKMEGKIGSPEKPLSDLGLISYRAYWKDIILNYMCNYPDKDISIKSMAEEMGIHSYDIVSTLQYLGMIKYWKGKHVILKKEDIISDYLERISRRTDNHKQISDAYLKWKPYEPTAKEKRQAEQIKKKQEERQKAR